ncbi:MAG: DUF1501 domain-containing protein [Planctomycetota bacterium]
MTNARTTKPIEMNRRQMLSRAANGFGAMALAGLLAEDALGKPRISPSFAKAKSVIFLFMEGAVSQVDSFDYKPDLAKFNGQDPRRVIGKIEKTQFANIGKVLRSPWKFKRRGKSGLWASDLFPHMAGETSLPGIMDEVCVIKSMTSKFPEHTSANYFLHSGHGLQGRPSMGAWVTYGLGSHNDELPGFVVLNGGQIPSGGLDNFTSGFLPAVHQGSLLNAIGTPLANVHPHESATHQASKRALVRKLNSHSLELTGPSDALESAIRNYELAARMQTAIPELMNVDDETAETRRLYGVDSSNKHTATYARQCLVARRLVERGVRFIELTIPMTNGYQRWDAHGDLKSNHSRNAAAVDRPITALIHDLKRRGMLDDTLVLWGSEFGRTPFAQGGKGRDHNEFGFTMWMAGGGMKPGISYGETDRWGYKTVENPLEIHDLHATILHQLGIDHTELTYRFSGRDIRLTDVRGRVIHDLLV